MILVMTLVVVAASPVLELVPWITSHYDQKRVAELTVILISLMAFAARLPRFHPLPKAAWRSIALVAALGAISASLAPSPRHAIMEVALFAGLFFLTLSLASSYRERQSEALDLTCWLLLVGTSALLVQFLAGCAGALIQGRALSAEEIVPGFSNIRFLNQIQTWTIPLLALGLSAHLSPSRTLIAASYVALGGSWLMLIATGARGSILALTVAAVLSLSIFGRKARAFWKFQTVGVLIGLLTYLAIFHVAPRLTGLGESLGPTLDRTSDAGRIALWQQAATLIAENPLLGVGPQHFAWYENAFSLAHPHNGLLQIAAEWGTPAALVALSLALWAFVKWTVSARARPAGLPESSLRIVLWVSLVAGAIHSLLTGIMVMPLSQLLMAIVCGALLGTYDSGGKGPSDQEAKSGRYSRLFAVLALIVLATSVTPDLLARLAGGDPLPTSMAVTGPRFWQLGGIPH